TAPRADGQTPRTSGRDPPSGQPTEPQVALFCLVSLAVFLLAVWQLDPIVRWLWPIPVAGFVIYPYLKRLTWISHLWLRRGHPRAGSKSVATAFGERGAFWAARVLHVATVGLLIWVGVLLDVGVFYWLGVIAVAALLIYEHALVRPGNLRRLDTAFFLMNGIIS